MLEFSKGMLEFYGVDCGVIFYNLKLVSLGYIEGLMLVWVI